MFSGGRSSSFGKGKGSNAAASITKPPKFGKLLKAASLPKSGFSMKPLSSLLKANFSLRGKRKGGASPAATATPSSDVQSTVRSTGTLDLGLNTHLGHADGMAPSPTISDLSETTGLGERDMALESPASPEGLASEEEGDASADADAADAQAGEVEPRSMWEEYKEARLRGRGLRAVLVLLLVLVALFLTRGIKQAEEAGILEPTEEPRVESGVLERGSVLSVGEVLYSCRPSGGEAPCAPTLFFLEETGRLVLARGEARDSVGEVLWASKPGRVKSDGYVAEYGRDGALRVSLKGKRVYKRKAWQQPKELRPWPLSV